MFEVFKTRCRVAFVALFVAGCGGTEVPDKVAAPPANPPKPPPTASVPTAPASAGASAAPLPPNSASLPPSVPAAPPSRALSVVKPIEIGKWPEDMVVSGGFSWIAESGARRVAQIDLATNTVKNRVSVGRLPVEIVAGADGTIYTSCRTDQAIWSIQPSTLAAKTFARVSDYPQDMIFANGALWVLLMKGNSSADSSVVRIDLPSGKQSKSVALGANAFELAMGFGRVWVVHHDQVSVIDEKTLAPLPDITPGIKFAMHVAVGAKAVFITDADSVLRLDPESGKITHTTNLGELVFVLETVRDEVLAAGRSGKIYRLDPGTLAMKEILTPATNAFEPSDVRVSGAQLLVTTHASLGGGADKEAGTLLVLE